MTLIPTVQVDELPRASFPDVIDNSALDSFKSCPRKFYYQYLRHLRTRGETSIHLLAGGALAAGLEETRLRIYRDKESTESAVLAGQRKILEHFGDAEVSNTPKTPEAVCVALAEYFDFFRPETDHIQPMMIQNHGVSEPAVEFSFAMPLGLKNPETEEEILYVGRFDMFGERRNGESVVTYIVDEKTTTRLGPTWLKQWDLRSQFTGYAWAAREHNYPVGGCVVRGISFLANRFEFAESISSRSELDIERWKFTTSWYITQMVEMWKTHTFPQNLGDACTAYSGCPYKVLCKARDPEKWVYANFEVRKWNPVTGTTELIE